MAEPKKYRPSNGTEGDWFYQTYCMNCIHGKYEYTQDMADVPCDILTRTMCFGVNDKEYPTEWIYENDKPKCTAFVKWDWNKDDDGNWIAPTPPPFEDPNQLCLPFIFYEI